MSAQHCHLSSFLVVRSQPWEFLHLGVWISLELNSLQNLIKHPEDQLFGVLPSDALFWNTLATIISLDAHLHLLSKRVHWEPAGSTPQHSGLDLLRAVSHHRAGQGYLPYLKYLHCLGSSVLKNIYYPVCLFSAASGKWVHLVPVSPCWFEVEFSTAHLY